MDEPALIEVVASVPPAYEWDPAEGARPGIRAVDVERNARFAGQNGTLGLVFGSTGVAVTLTAAEEGIVRYWFRLPEACEYALPSGSTGRAGYSGFLNGEHPLVEISTRPGACTVDARLEWVG